MRVLLLSFLVFSLLVFSFPSAFPSSTGRSSKPGIMVEEDGASSGQDFLPQEDASSDDIGMDAASGEVLSEEEAGRGLALMEGRMVIQSNDYPGTGANNHHDPKPPTRD